jgi:hypothetical protein
MSLLSWACECRWLKALNMITLQVPTGGLIKGYRIAGFKVKDNTLYFTFVKK